jgi:hypothetical protein
MTNKKRLLKDLPFGELTKGDVLRKCNGGYVVEAFDTFYTSGGSSSGGVKTLDGSEINILDIIWENPEWFEDAELKHIEFKMNFNSITLKFEPLSAEDVQDLTRGIIHILPRLRDGPYVWGKFNGLTTSISNQRK